MTGIKLTNDCFAILKSGKRVGPLRAKADHWYGNLFRCQKTQRAFFENGNSADWFKPSDHAIIAICKNGE